MYWLGYVPKQRTISVMVEDQENLQVELLHVETEINKNAMAGPNPGEYIQAMRNDLMAKLFHGVDPYIEWQSYTTEDGRQFGRVVSYGS